MRICHTCGIVHDMALVRNEASVLKRMPHLNKQ